MFLCPACQTENRPTAKFCRKCGLRRQGAEGSAVAVAEPVEKAAEPAPPPAGSELAVSQPTVPATGASVPTPPAGLAEEAEEDFGEEITEEEVQQELEQNRATAQSDSGQQSPTAKQTSPAAEASQAPPADQPAGGAQTPEPRRGGYTCPSCGSNVRVTDKHCIWCGERQPQRSVPKMKRCSECRTQLPMAANFCFVCGNDVSLHLRRKVRVPSELFHEEDPELFPTYEA